MTRTVMSRREFEARQEEFSSDHFDFYWNHDYTEVEVVRLEYWDDASYQKWQGDLLGNLPPSSMEDTDE